jgi:integrase
MSSRALTREVIEKMYAYNHAEGRSEVQPFMDRKAKQSWGNPRRRLLVHAVLTVAFVCLLRIDEALNLRFEDIIFHSPEKIEIHLFKRKTHQCGGLSHISITLT